MHKPTPRMRLRLVGGALVALAALLLAAPTGAATTTTTGAPQSSFQLLNGVTVGAATVTTPGKPTTHLTADQFTAFLQSWVPDSIFQKIPNVARPKNVAISTLDSTTAFDGVTVPFKTLYAAVGSTVFVGFPAESLGWSVVSAEKWIEAPAPVKTAEAFAGKVKPVSISSPGTTTTTVPGSSTTIGTAAPKGGSSSSTKWPLYAIPAVIIVGLGVWLVGRRKSSRTSPTG